MAPARRTRKWRRSATPHRTSTRPPSPTWCGSRPRESRSARLGRLAPIAPIEGAGMLPRARTRRRDDDQVSAANTHGCNVSSVEGVPLHRRRATVRSCLQLLESGPSTGRCVTWRKALLDGKVVTCGANGYGQCAMPDGMHAAPSMDLSWQLDKTVQLLFEPDAKRRCICTLRVCERRAIRVQV